MVFKKGHKFYGDKNRLANYIKKNGVWNKGIKLSKEKYGQMGYQKYHKVNLGRKCKEETKEKIGKANKISLKKYFKNHKPWNFIDGLWNKRKNNRKEAIFVWCYENQIHRVPDDCMIHHINQNPLDNRPENLQLMTKSFHNKLHSEFIKQMKGEFQ